MSKLLIRYYENELPEIDDVVLGRVCRINDYGFKVVLPEYRDMEAFLNFRDASKKRKLIRIKQEVRQNHEYTFVVINVDEDKNYVELARKDQTPEDDEEFYNYFKQYKSCMGILSSYFWKADINDADAQEEFMNRTFWKIERDDLYDLLKELQTDNTTCKEHFDLEEEEIELLLEIIKTTMKEEKCTVQAELKIISYEIDGKGAIINLLKKVEDIVKVPIVVKSPPIYTFRLNDILDCEFDSFCDNIREKLAEIKTENIIFGINKFEKL